MKLHLTILALFLILSSCTEELDHDNPVIPKEKQEETLSLIEKIEASEVASYEVQKDLNYGPNKFHTYDLYKPIKSDNNPSPVMIVIHGGGWSSLDKSFMGIQVNEITKRKKNLTIFNINHRLAGINGTTYDDIIQDLDRLMNEVQKKKVDLNLSDDILLYGYSSGGHLALEYSKLRKSNSNIKVVSASAPPVDLTSQELRKSIVDKQNRNLTELFIGTSFSQNPEAYKEASPLYKVSPESKPTLLFHGENDQIVSNKQVEKMSETLTENGVTNDLVQFEQTGHEFKNREDDIADELFNFIERL